MEFIMCYIENNEISFIFRLNYLYQKDMAEDCEGDNPPIDNEDSEPQESAKSGSSNEDDEKIEGPPEKKDSTRKAAALTPPPSHEVIEEYVEDILYEYECPSCGSGVSEEMTKCPSCGAEFGVEEEEEIPKYECPICGASVTADMTNCPICDVILRDYIKFS